MRQSRASLLRGRHRFPLPPACLNLSIPILLLVGFASQARADTDILHGIATMGDSSSIKSAVQVSCHDANLAGLELRRPNLPYVHAVGGSTSATVLSGMQPEKVAAAVQAGNVTVTTLEVGNNDYGQNIVQLLQDTPEQLTAFENSVISNIEQATDIVLDSGIQGFLLGSVPSLLVEPAAAPYIPLVPPDVLQTLDDSQQRVNTALEAFADSKHIPFVDFYGLEKSFNGADHITVGGVPISLTGMSTTDPHYFFVDNLHPGWVGNAILSNMWMTALNVAYGTNLTLFSDKETLDMAGLTGYTGDTFTGVVNYADFIHFTPVPEPSSVILAALSLFCTVAWGCRRRWR